MRGTVDKATFINIICTFNAISAQCCFLEVGCIRRDYHLSTTVKTISSAASIHLFQKKFLGELVLHW